MPRFTASIVIATLAIATPALAQEPAAMTAQARAVIAKRMVHPASLQLRSTRFVRATSPQGQQAEILCGEYNAKNRMGGFTGFKMFMFEPAELSGVVSIDLPRGLDFSLLDGRDARQDTRGNYAQGDSVAEEHARYQRASHYAIHYAGFCMS